MVNLMAIDFDTIKNLPTIKLKNSVITIVIFKVQIHTTTQVYPKFTKTNPLENLFLQANLDMINRESNPGCSTGGR